MADSAATVELDREGPAAPPRRNGELVFETPWESRLFGITLALHQAGRFEWEAFRALLIAEIADWDRDREGQADAAYSYYQHWQAALEKLLARTGLCDEADLDARDRALASRPEGHDH